MRETERYSWRPEEIEFVRELYVAGNSQKDIAKAVNEKFGIASGTRGSVNGIVHRYFKAERAAVAAKIKQRLDDERARARALIEGGLSVADAAKALGTSINRFYTLVPTDKRPHSRPTDIFHFREWLERQEASPVPDDPITEDGKPLLDLEASDCRWPIGKDADGQFRFCGCQFHHDKTDRHKQPYCEAHAMQSHRIDRVFPETERARRAAHARKNVKTNFEALRATTIPDNLTPFDELLKVA